MKRVLLGTTALVAAGLASSPAMADDDGIKLSLGGFFRTAVEGNIEGGNSELSHGHDSDSVDSDAEIYFSGKTTLDDGLTVGAHVELEGEQNNDQIDAAYAYFQGGFGEVRIGSQGGALATMCVTPVGGTANFGAFSQDQVINNAFGNGYSNGICNSVDGFGVGIPEDGNKAQKILYISPSFGGFQLGLSWSPNGGHEFSGVTDFHSGQPTVEDGEQRNVVDAYATFTRDFDGWSLQSGLGGSWALSVGGSGAAKENDYYQAAMNLTFGGFSIGAAGEYYHNFAHFADDDQNGDAYVVGGGMAYNVDAWTVGFQYSYGDWQFTDSGVDRWINTAALTGKYALGPGIALDSTVQYTWANGDEGDAAQGKYRAVSLGLGTSFTF
jgi:outer membrane protein OmpU